ncbi:MAG: LCP family protein [Chloroflexi bacterium]|nr:LCP family protein [Chloroflexota bacterium]
MSVQEAFPAPHLAHSSPPPLRKSAYRPRRLRFFGVALLGLLLSFLLSAGVLLYCPTVLEAMSAIILEPQPGAIPWNGHDRITVVAMGLTQRTTEPARTDTLLVMDIDPPHHRINVLSVPRDLWVNIPGYGQGKLAIAYEVGDQTGKPGAGARLAAYTLEHELGIPVDYTISLTFGGFTRLVDAIGGVTVDVPQELNDPTYPCLVGYAYCPIDIKPGRQHMDGATALEFVRERHAFSQQDLARVKDQQAFADALKRTAISPSTWPRYPALLDALRKNLRTNLPFNDLPAVGLQYVLPTNHVSHHYIDVDNGLVRTDWSQDGESILVPTDTTSIPRLVHQLFWDTTLVNENASVAVLNGTGTAGEAADVENTLAGLGFHTVAAGNADSDGYQQSEVIVNTAQRGQCDYTARRLQRILDARLVREALPGQSAQVVAIIGSDFLGS